MQEEHAALATEQNIIQISLEMIQKDLKTTSTESWTKDLITAAEVRKVTNSLILA